MVSAQRSRGCSDSAADCRYGRDRNRRPAVSNQLAIGSRGIPVDEIRDSRDLDRLAVKIEYVSAFRRSIRTSDKGRGRIGDILKVSRAAEAYAKRKSQRGGFHRLRRIARQTRIAIDSINCQRS